MSTAKLPATLASTLQRSATQVFKNGDLAILDARRALEDIVARLFEKAMTRSSSGLGVADMLYDLRGHPSVPDSDWYQAKNLYARASAVVHASSSTLRTPQLALWIWLGVYQLAELVQTGPSAEDPSDLD